MVNTPKVLDVIEADLCIGCGVCTYNCPTQSLEMKWNEDGFLVPNLISECDSSGNCITVCPFNPEPEKIIRTENELSDIFQNNSLNSNSKIGKYLNIYAGYSNEFRLSSSSGGIATYILTNLLEKKIVDHVFSVNESSEAGVHYSYCISSSKEDLLASSKTKYFPVTLASVLSKLDELDGKVAIVGVACFIKSIRLLQFQHPRFREKIPFLVGIICGGIKSKFYTEYLSNKLGVEINNIKSPEFRIKDPLSTAGDYSFGCIDLNENKQKSIKMKSIGDMWGTGMFKANGCDFCDDVTTELADISLGDAWKPPFSADGRGNSIIVTRSLLADNLISDGLKNKVLDLVEIGLERFIQTQQGSFNHRHKGLKYRIHRAKRLKLVISPKRFNLESISLDSKLIQILRMRIRKKSIEFWKTSPNALEFDSKMKIDLKILRLLTKLNHVKKAILKRIKKVL